MTKHHVADDDGVFFGGAATEADFASFDVDIRPDLVEGEYFSSVRDVTLEDGMTKLFRISEGAAVEVPEWMDEDNPTEVVYALAKDTDQALALAESYDRGEIMPDNAQWQGDTIVALQPRGA